LHPELPAFEHLWIGGMKRPTITGDNAMTSFRRNPAPVFAAGLLLAAISGSALADREAFELLTRNPVDNRLPDSLYNSDNPAITPDGRYVVFESSQTGLVAPATNGNVQIFLYDRRLNQVELVSATPAGAAGNNASNHAAISADGCKVVFESLASDLTVGDTNNLKDVFLRNRCTAPPQTQLLSLGASGEQSTKAGSGEPDIAADGNSVAFYYGGSGGGSPTPEGVYLRNLQTGTSQCISATQQTSACTAAHLPAISADGSRVAFWSFAPLLPSDTNGVWDIYVFDRNAAALSIASVSATGQQRTQGNESTSRVVAPAISADGRYVAFATTSPALVANDTNGFQDVFVKDTVTGAVVLASVSSTGAQGNADTPASQGERPSLSADGRWVVFTTSASNLTLPRGTGSSNVIAHNVITGATIDFAAPPRFGVGSRAVVSPDALGRFVAFFATDPLDGRFDSSGVFVHDRVTHCLLNWAEQSVYANMFPPTTNPTQVLPPYTFRVYPNTYLGTSNADDHVYYVIQAEGLVPHDVGLLTNYTAPSNCR
jgi:Tol biopolymer transport system component